MTQTVLNITAGLLALVAFIAIIWGAASKAPRVRLWGLRLGQVGMSFAGVLLIVKGFLGGGTDGFFQGFMLLVFGTGVTALGAAKSKTGPEA